MSTPTWRAWARELLAKCARAENRIRADFDPDGRMGTQPEDPMAVDDDDMRELVESWALGNLSARREALKAGLDLEQERARPVAEFAHAARVRALSGGLLLSAGRVRLSLTLAAARDAYRAMREILETSVGDVARVERDRARASLAAWEAWAQAHEPHAEVCECPSCVT